MQELLQRQLQEANRKAQEYRQQLMRKEQEAEHYRIKLEAISHGQSNGNATPDEEVAEEEGAPHGEGEEVVEEEEVVVESAASAGEELLVLSEGAVIVKAEELDSEQQLTLVEATASHTEVIS